MKSSSSGSLQLDTAPSSNKYWQSDCWASAEGRGSPSGHTHRRISDPSLEVGLWLIEMNRGSQAVVSVSGAGAGGVLSVCLLRR